MGVRLCQLKQSQIKGIKAAQQLTVPAATTKTSSAGTELELMPVITARVFFQLSLIGWNRMITEQSMQSSQTLYSYNSFAEDRLAS